MDREISNGAMLGIVLLVLAAIIALGFGVFAIMKGVANDGTVDVQDSLGSVSSQVFIDYDQKVITGSKVTSSLKTFEGKAYAVLIGTSSLRDGGYLYTDHDATILNDGKNAFINYNALLAKDTSGKAIDKTPYSASTKVTKNSGETGIISLDKGTYILDTGFQSVKGEVQFDNATEGIYKTGNAEFISQTAKFKANLIKDKSGTIVGIATSQLK